LSDIGALREVGGELADFFDPRDPAALASCLQGLAFEVDAPAPEKKVPVMAGGGEGDSAAERPEIEPAERAHGDGVRARLAWSSQFSWERCAEGVQKIYDKSYD